MGSKNFPTRKFKNGYNYSYANDNKHGNRSSIQYYNPEEVKKVSEPPQSNVSEINTNPHNQFSEILTKTN